MQLKWFRKKDGSTKTVVVATETSKGGNSAPSPSLVNEDAAQTIVRARNMNTWLDDAFRECVQNGGMDNLDNKGKPVVVKGGDPLNSMLKNANVLPPWLELQHEIRKQILLLIERMNLGQQDVTDDINRINQQITKYNLSVPTPILQKGRLAENSIREQVQLWL
ncbi:MAG: hypothetical protein K0Q81_1525 [Paenibacillus sp.]|nr:hypothetical protein [Paenibacillus sp.]